MVEHHILPNGEVHSSTVTPVNTEVVNIGSLQMKKSPRLRRVLGPNASRMFPMRLRPTTV
ncbi:hypothetical protein K474DRAFT_1667339 [Panus rudis PR-1116 ss-1]|nr:hypothetical protein K474DRAFT_1668747 [Panus rudis PR-1116 ss-1]KAI0072846.1 hypothetical protein K474DRAFT_1667339 [Panus rudis PR-1116 ss-1]